MIWKMLHPDMTMEHLGFLPEFLSEDDPRPAKEQIHTNYQHGGGWRTMKGFAHVGNLVLQYPGDPPFSPLAQTKLRDETIVFYPGEFVAIFQPDGSFEASRVD
jgi:hypothetical protein